MDLKRPPQDTSDHIETANVTGSQNVVIGKGISEARTSIGETHNIYIATGENLITVSGSRRIPLVVIAVLITFFAGFVGIVSDVISVWERLGARLGVEPTPTSLSFSNLITALLVIFATGIFMWLVFNLVAWRNEKGVRRKQQVSQLHQIEANLFSEMKERTRIIINERAE